MNRVSRLYCLSMDSDGSEQTLLELKQTLSNARAVNRHADHVACVLLIVLVAILWVTYCSIPPLALAGGGLVSIGLGLVVAFVSILSAMACIASLCATHGISRVIEQREIIYLPKFDSPLGDLERAWHSKSAKDYLEFVQVETFNPSDHQLALAERIRIESKLCRRKHELLAWAFLWLRVLLIAGFVLAAIFVFIPHQISSKIF